MSRYETIIRSLFWSLGPVPDRQKCLFGTSPRYKYCSLGLVPDTKTDSLGLDIYYIYYYVYIMEGACSSGALNEQSTHGCPPG